MASYSSIAWKIPGAEEPGGLRSMASQRAGHNRESAHTPLTWPWLPPGWRKMTAQKESPKVTPALARHCVYV